MSHLKERAEKNCLNCNAQVQGKFCPICGQENIHPKESVWHLVNHFFQDVTHFDGKFFSTVKLLLTKPGFLSAQYAVGKRATYLNPIRLYVFTSALFFLIFFSFIQKEEQDVVESSITTKELVQKLEEKKAGLQNAITLEADKEEVARMTKKIAKFNNGIILLQKDSSVKDSIRNEINEGWVTAFDNKYNRLATYDSAQQKMPASKQDGWIQQKIQRRMLTAKAKYNGNFARIEAAFVHKFNHSFPQLLFLSLPFFALALTVLYIRQKQFYYVNHLIFGVHLYCAIFILILLHFGFSAIENNLHWKLFGWITTLITLTIFFYQYKAMRNFYQQSRFKTVIKYVLLNFTMLFIIAFLTIVMLIFTAYQI